MNRSAGVQGGCLTPDHGSEPSLFVAQPQRAWASRQRAPAQEELPALKPSRPSHRDRCGWRRDLNVRLHGSGSCHLEHARHSPPTSLKWVGAGLAKAFPKCLLRASSSNTKRKLLQSLWNRDYRQRRVARESFSSPRPLLSQLSCLKVNLLNKKYPLQWLTCGCFSLVQELHAQVCVGGPWEGL